MRAVAFPVLDTFNLKQGWNVYKSSLGTLNGSGTAEKVKLYR